MGRRRAAAHFVQFLFDAIQHLYDILRLNLQKIGTNCQATIKHVSNKSHDFKGF